MTPTCPRCAGYPWEGPCPMQWSPLWECWSCLRCSEMPIKYWVVKDGVLVEVRPQDDTLVPVLRYFSDSQRHLVCWPYTVDNLHKMAKILGIKRCWYDPNPAHPHYDVPQKDMRVIRNRTEVVSPREILKIVKGGTPEPYRGSS